MPGPLAGSPFGGDVDMKGGRRGASVKTLKRMLKKAGLKTSGRKAALTRRAKKAHLKMRGGEDGVECDDNGMPEGCTPKVVGGRRKSRKSRGFRLY
jgi:hypothetical protein